MKIKIFLLLLLFSSLINGYPECDTLEFHNNETSLMGYIYASTTHNSPTLIFTQGFMETGDIWDLGKTLSQNNINVFMFDFSGCFNSGGKQSLKNSQLDIEAAILFLKSTEISKKYFLDTAKIILGGYSYGGHMSMLYAIHNPKIKKVISISGGDLGIFANLIKKNSNLRNGYLKFFQSIQKPLGPVDFKYSDPLNELDENYEYFDIISNTNKLRNAHILLVGGADDNVVSLEDYILPLYRNLEQTKNTTVDLAIYQTGHSYENVTENLLETIENWIKEIQW